MITHEIGTYNGTLTMKMHDIGSVESHRFVQDLESGGVRISRVGVTLGDVRFYLHHNVTEEFSAVDVFKALTGRMNITIQQIEGV